VNSRRSVAGILIGAPRETRSEESEKLAIIGATRVAAARCRGSNKPTDSSSRARSEFPSGLSLVRSRSASGDPETIPRLSGNHSRKVIAQELGYSAASGARIGDIPRLLSLFSDEPPLNRFDSPQSNRRNRSRSSRIVRAKRFPARSRLLRSRPMFSPGNPPPLQLCGISRPFDSKLCKGRGHSVYPDAIREIRVRNSTGNQYSLDNGE